MVSQMATSAQYYPQLMHLHLFTEMFHKDFFSFLRTNCCHCIYIYLQNCFIRISSHSLEQTANCPCIYIYLQNCFIMISSHSLEQTANCHCMIYKLTHLPVRDKVANAADHEADEIEEDYYHHSELPTSTPTL